MFWYKVGGLGGDFIGIGFKLVGATSYLRSIDRASIGKNRDVAVSSTCHPLARDKEDPWTNFGKW